MEWFEDWFDSRYYHVLYKHRSTTEASAFIEKLLDSIDLAPESRILDLACGKGRHALEFQKYGHFVTGIDLSQNSIKAAKEFSNDHLAFRVADMREDIGSSEFDLVVNLFTSFGYFQNENDNRLVLRRIHEALDTNGIFVLDYLNCSKAKTQLVEKEQIQIDGITFDIVRHVDNRAFRKRITVTDDSTEATFEEFVQNMSKHRLSELAKEAGFFIENVYGDYQLCEFNENDSDRIIIVARKRI